MTDQTDTPAGAGQAIDDTWNRLRTQDRGGTGQGGGIADDPVRRGIIEDDIPQPAVSDDDDLDNDIDTDIPDDDDEEIGHDLPPLDTSRPVML